MSITAVVGAQWGDEGKGKITDYLAAQSDLVVRYQGGSNAGHTIINEHGKFALHLLPSGVFHPHVVNVLGPGVAVNAPSLLAEWEQLLARGIEAPQLRLSNRAQLVLPYHILFDRLEEERLGARQFGSTRSGIAPFYSDKYAKIGIQVADLYDAGRLHRRLQQALETKNVLLEHLYGAPKIELRPLFEELLELAEPLRPFLCDTNTLMHEAVRAGKGILLEGQLGALRDPDHGIYPYTTSSSPLAGFATVGAGLPTHRITRIIAVVKSYSSCVGNGPFVSEIDGEAAHELRERGGDGGEYGATTGRPRRMGWLDLVATRYGCRCQGATEVALSLLDVLGYLDEIPVCERYEGPDGYIDDFPTSCELEMVEPSLVRLPGWRTDIRSARKVTDLPAQARSYVEFVEQRLETPIRWISVGPRREEVIEC